MLSFVEIGPPVPKQIMKNFDHIWAWGLSWSCDQDYLLTHWLPFAFDASYKKNSVIGKGVLDKH